jgi:D-aminopeptidase
MNQKRIADYGIHIGELPRGPRNKLSDVPGVRVGHATVDSERHKTGVTVVTFDENPFISKLAAGCAVLNGFGKTTGLVQLDELGTLECPIALTNTLNLGLVHDAVVDYMIEQCQQLGVRVTSINPLVAECNDSYLNDIQARAVRREHVRQAFESATADFAEGDVGAGKGMSAFQLKGGIGSASRLLELDRVTYTLGVLALANFGALPDLTIQGRAVGREIARRILKRDERGGAQAGELRLDDVAPADDEQPPATSPPPGGGSWVDRGSVIIVMGADLPLSDRQIRRVCRRASIGLARLGSTLGHGSGDIVIGFSTANRFGVDEPRAVVPLQALREDRLEGPFRAMAEATEEAVLNALVTAKRTVGYQGHTRESLRDYLS